MKKKKMILGMIGGLLMASLLSGCETKDKEELEQSFDKVLSLYPTKNLMDFYDMEGYRDSDFEDGDKGVWSILSSMAIAHENDDPLVSEGMLLRMNRNTKSAKGYYFQESVSNDPKVATVEKRYPVTYDEEGFHLVKDTADDGMKEKIENFQFFVQYGDFKNLEKYNVIQKSYNPAVPSYVLGYQLINEDNNVQQLRERYDIPIDSAPELTLKGRGNLEGSSSGYKSMEIRFSRNPPVFFSDLIDYQPTSEEDK